jgi:hypothetical protein
MRPFCKSCWHMLIFAMALPGWLGGETIHMFVKRFFE